MKRTRAFVAVVLASACHFHAQADEPQVVVTPLGETIAAARTAKASQGAIRDALKRRVTVSFQDTPLRDAVDFVKSAAGLRNARIHKVSLEEEGIAADSPVTYSAEQVTVGQALHRILSPLQLTWTFHGETLEILTEVKAEERRVTRVYPISRLAAVIHAEQQRDPNRDHPSPVGTIRNDRTPAQRIADLIQQTITGPWQDFDGAGGRIDAFRSTIAVRHTEATQEEVAGLLRALEMAIDGQLERSSAMLLPSWSPADDVQRIREAMSRRIPTVELIDTPLQDALSFLKDKLVVPLVIDQPSLQEEGIALDVPVTLSAEDLTGRSALEQILEPLNLTTVVDHGVLLVTTTVRAEERMETRVYDIRGLAHDGADATLVPWVENETGGMWQSTFGAGGLAIVPFAGVMVVQQTQKCHEEIADALEHLRETLEQHPDEPPADAALAAPETIATRFYPIARKGVAEQIAETLPKLIARDSWADEGIVIEVVDGTLVVRQSHKVHSEIQTFLKNLKAAENAPTE